MEKKTKMLRWVMWLFIIIEYTFFILYVTDKTPLLFVIIPGGIAILITSYGIILTNRKNRNYGKS